ncbi:MAG TPA: S8 family serine peptidase [Thermoanaerobaculia bacterium]|nr:S8 family serine peptidase [Thermoanaerobaculia bacterium]
MNNRWHRSTGSLCFFIAALWSVSTTAQPAIVNFDPSGPSRYIVALKDDAGTRVIEIAASVAAVSGGTVTHIYEHAVRGFTIETTAQEALALAADPRVKFVEQDSQVHADREMENDATQNSPPWGLDRIDQRDRPLSGTYTYNNTGAGVTAYIVDSGINATHVDFGGRVRYGFNFEPNHSGADCNGHGSHVAGTVGGSTYGVAKGVSLVSARVLNCNGSGWVSDFVDGINWCIADHAAGQPAVMNMSVYSDSPSTGLDLAVNDAINDGIVVCVLAGNGTANNGVATDACNISPARVTNAITVGSVNSSDTKASSSNFGSCVDLFAPGVSILSVGYTSSTATDTKSGTSMATPHVTGAAALYVAANPGATPAATTTALVNSASVGKLTSIGSGSPNRLLYMGDIGSSSTTEKIVNGGFEQTVSTGNSSPGWTLFPAQGHTVFQQGGSYPHAGTAYAYLGSTNSATDILKQTVSIPATASSAQITFWVNVVTSETTSTTKYDYLFVDLYNTNGSWVSAVAEITNLNSPQSGNLNGVYFKVGPIEVSEYAGSTLQLVFDAFTDSSLPTTFRLDDVSLMITEERCYSLSASAAPGSAGSASINTQQNCPGGFDAGTQVSISASANPGYQFSSWSSTNCSLANASASSTTCTMSGNGNATVTANFVANWVVSISAVTPNASESGPTNGTFSVSRTGPTSGSLTVFYTIGGSATNGTDYSSISSSVTIPSGSGSTNISIVPIADGSSEGSETVILTLSSNAQYSIGSPSSDTVTITDSAPPGAQFYLITPCRLLDTRNSVALASGSSRTVQVSGACSIPSGARAVAVNITAVSPPATGYFTLYQQGITRPTTSTMNYRLNRTRANNAIIPLSNVGQLIVYNDGGMTHFLLDVTGYFQ